MNTDRLARSLGIGAFVLLVGACSSSAQQARTPAPSDVVATVGSASITLATVDDKALEQPRRQLRQHEAVAGALRGTPRRRRRDRRQPAAGSGSEAPGHRPRDAGPAGNHRQDHPGDRGRHRSLVSGEPAARPGRDARSGAAADHAAPEAGAQPGRPRHLPRHPEGEDARADHARAAAAGRQRREEPGARAGPTPRSK